MENLIILKSQLTTKSKIEQYSKPLCSISGGADSDIMLDLVVKNDPNKKTTYIFFDTGLEFEATKKQLAYLEEKYNIKINRIKAIKPIPLCVKQYGSPFLSKYVSEMMSRLQAHDFKWEDKPFEELYKEYPKCKIALMWWCNEHGERSQFNINNTKHLKEFILENPPDFKISNKCCFYAKKKTAASVKKDYDLDVIGVRKAEGGIRNVAYKNCFSPESDKKIAQYRPLFWYNSIDKEEYEKDYDITHSECYTKWKLRRTGCSGCPYAREFEHELNATKENEPKLYKALINVFGKSYEYTRKFKEFKEKNK